MPKYIVETLEKVEVWQEVTIVVKAEDEEGARRKVGMERDLTYINTETFYDSEKLLTREIKKVTKESD